MTIRFASFSSSYHLLRRDRLERINPEFVEGLDRIGVPLDSSALCSRTLLAYEDGGVVGVWSRVVIRQDGKLALDSYYTYVSRAYRRRGIASALWNHTLKNLPDRTEVHLNAATELGEKFAKGLYPLHSNLEWILSF